jgi:hypothetical protein
MGSKRVFALTYSNWRREMRMRGPLNRVTKYSLKSSVDVRPPQWLFLPALAVLLWNSVSSLRGAVLGGISWDEPNHVWMLQGWFDSGYYAEANLASHERETTLIFGPVSDLFGHILAVASRLEAWGAPTLSANSYFARHLATAGMSLVGVLAIVAIGKLVLGSWRWGVVAGAMLTSIPMWSGLAMFDQKDIGVASGFTVFTLGLILLLRDHVLFSRTWLTVAFFLMTGGIVVCVGTRISIAVLVCLAAGTGLVIAYVSRGRRLGFRRSRTPLATWSVAIVAAGLAAYGILVLIYPLAFAHPFSTFPNSIRQSGSVFMNADFQIYPERPARTYVLEWFFIQTPIVIAVLFLLGMAASTIFVGQGIVNRQPVRKAVINEVGLAILIVQAVAAPMLVIAAQSILFHSIRHLLFIYPAVALLATTGAWSAVQFSENRRSNGSRWAPLFIFIVTLAAIAVPSIDQARLFPYAYAYFNPIARLIGIDGRWPTDYWRTSWRELYSQIPTNEFAVCPDSIHFPNDTMYGWPVDQSFSCEFETKVNPFFTKAPNYDVSTGHFWFLRENAGEIYVPKNCKLQNRVTRPLGLGEITLSYLEYCDYVPVPSSK